MYADDLMLLVESEKLLAKLREWKFGFEDKGLKVNIGRTKVI